MEENDQHENKLEPRNFDQVLTEIEKSTKQNAIISDGYLVFCKILLSIAVACFLIFASLEIWRLGFSVVYPILGTALALGCLYFANNQFAANSVKVKSKDRIYFLKCIQAAQSVDELDQLGFFRVPPCRTGDEYKKDREIVSQKMIKTFSSRS